MLALPTAPARPRLINSATATLDAAGPGAAGAAWPDVVRHSYAVAALAARAAACAGLAGRDVVAARACGLLHDVGKAGVPGDLLAKPGGLGGAEWELVEAHSAIGEAIVARVAALAHLAPAVRAVHERWDGAGYPDGLARREIPRTARLVAACDAYVAMTEARAYGRRASHREALAELRAGAGSQFDPCSAAAVALATGGGRIAHDAPLCAAV